MSITVKAAKLCGLVRDYDGRCPCLPPLALAKLVERVLLRVRVRQDTKADGGLL